MPTALIVVQPFYLYCQNVNSLQKSKSVCQAFTWRCMKNAHYITSALREGGVALFSPQL